MPQRADERGGVATDLELVDRGLLVAVQVLDRILDRYDVLARGRVDVQVDKNARLYRDAKAQMIQLGLLGDMAIDFTQGTQESGRAKKGDTFAGERKPDLGEAAAKMLEVIKPVANVAECVFKN